MAALQEKLIGRDMSRKKVLFLATFKTDSKTNNVFGGAEKSLINLANWLSCNSNDFDITIASVEGTGKPFNISGNVCFIGYEVNNLNKVSTHISIYRNTIKAIKTVKPDVVISFTIHPLAYGINYCTKQKIKTIYSERNDPRLEYGKITQCLRQRMLRKVDFVVFQTHDAQRYFDESVQKKSEVIFNPTYIRYSDYKLNEKTDNRIVTVGRLFPQKNQSLLIRAFSEIHKKYGELVLQIYGDGDLKTDLQNLINSLHLEKNVMLMGSSSRIIDDIYGAKLFVLPSIYEGMPNALIEAMSLGITCISSDCPCGGPRELIQNGVNGYLFKNGDLTDLIEKMRIALNENYLLRLESKKICYVLDQDKIFNRWRDLIIDMTNA